MNRFNPPKERIDQIAGQVLKALQDNPHIEVENPQGVKAAVRVVLTENLKEEHEIEQEAYETLRAHGQQIQAQGADFQAMLKKAKALIARKKGFDY